MFNKENSQVAEKGNTRKIKNDILILENDEVRYVIQLKWWVNLFCFISFAIKEIIEGVKNGKRKQGKY